MQNKNPSLAETGRLPSLEKLKKELQSLKSQRSGLTKEEEIQIGLDMIPMFQAKEEELLMKKEKIQNLKAELKEFGDE